jgi:hypothetical protein
VRIRSWVGFAFLCIPFRAEAQSIDEYFDLARAEFRGENAFESVAYIEQFWRLAGNSGFDKSIYHLEEKLKQAGFEKEGAANGRLTYRIEKRKLEEPSWEPISASLTLEGSSSPLLDFATNRNMISINSHSTKNEGIEGEVVQLADGRIPAGVVVKGKILYGEISPFRAYTLAAESGAIGIITYGNPSYLKPEINTRSIQFRSIPYNAGQKLWSICLSLEANEKLKASLMSGKIKVRVKIETAFPVSDELTLVAEIKGSELPEERFVLSAHLQEPGANDNASGAGALMEMARVSATWINEKKIDSRRTITFLWGDEIVSTRNFVSEDSARRKNIKWGLSLDMVGENTSLTGGRFLIEKMPDPSAIWTRGNDQHTEWGAGDVKEEDFFPHYFNDFVLEVFRRQAEFANWNVSYNPFEGGSDHVPFLQAGIPSVLLWHFTDQFYHTDLDRIDKVSKQELANVGNGALVVLFTLVNADANTAGFLINQTFKAGKARLSAEADLSKKAIQLGRNKQEELLIIDAWIRWYLNAIHSAKDIDSSDAGFNQINHLANQKAAEFQQFARSLKSQFND